MAQEPADLLPDDTEIPARATIGERLASLAPGGAAPDPEVWATAAIIVGSLGGLFLLRRTFKSALGQHAHLSALDTASLALHMVILMGITRTILSQPRVADTAVGKAFAFLGFGPD